MESIFPRIILAVLLFGGGAAGGIFLQIFLSKKESKWPGLILPAVTLAVSLFAVLGVIVFTSVTETIEVVHIADGKVVSSEYTTDARQITDTSDAIMTVVFTFCLYNIPTAALLAIYAVCRSKYNKRRALEKMNVQDLE